MLNLEQQAMAAKIRILGVLVLSGAAWGLLAPSTRGLQSTRALPSSRAAARPARYVGLRSDPSDDDDWCSHWVSEVRATYGSSLQVGTWRTMPTAPRPPCLLYTSPSPRDATLSRMPSSA